MGQSKVFQEDDSAPRESWKANPRRVSLPVIWRHACQEIDRAATYRTCGRRVPAPERGRPQLSHGDCRSCGAGSRVCAVVCARVPGRGDDRPHDVRGAGGGLRGLSDDLRVRDPIPHFRRDPSSNPPPLRTTADRFDRGYRRAVPILRATAAVTIVLVVLWPIIALVVGTVGMSSALLVAATSGTVDS